MNDSQNAPEEHPADPESPQVVAAAPPHPERYEGAVPPGYDWPTHGGYLGCLLGLMAACLLGGFAAKLVGLYTYYHGITGFANVFVLVAVFAVVIIACTNIGWRLGRRFYREYAPHPTWGESDAYVAAPPVDESASHAEADDADHSTSAVSTE